MPLASSLPLAALSAQPLECRLLEPARPTPVWVGRFRMHMPQAGRRPALCTVFEPDTLQREDLLYVDGLRRVRLLRQGKYWDARFFGVVHSPCSAGDHLAEAERAGAQRIRAVQCNLNEKLLRVSPLEPVDPAAVFEMASVSPIRTLAPADALRARQEGDIVLACDSNRLEWRCIEPIEGLLAAWRDSVAAPL